MNNNLKYSIIYAVLRPEISEQISIGLIVVDGDNVGVRCSQKKLKVLQELFSDEEYRFVSRVINSLKNNHNLKSVDYINYLARYSNNLLAISPLQTINVPPTKQSKNWLYKNYVYAGTKKMA